MQFCRLPCDDPFQQAIDQKMPPPRNTPPPDPSAPIFTKSSSNSNKRSFLNPPYISLLQQDMSMQFCPLSFDNLFQPVVDLHMPTCNIVPPDTAPVFTDSSRSMSKVDLLNPPYAINNAAGALSSLTAFVSSYNNPVCTESLTFYVVKRRTSFMLTVYLNTTHTTFLAQ